MSVSRFTSPNIVTLLRAAKSFLYMKVKAHVILDKTIILLSVPGTDESVLPYTDILASSPSDFSSLDLHFMTKTLALFFLYLQ